jgi:hypothetical protein
VVSPTTAAAGNPKAIRSLGFPTGPPRINPLLPTFKIPAAPPDRRARADRAPTPGGGSVLPSTTAAVAIGAAATLAALKRRKDRPITPNEKLQTEGVARFLETFPDLGGFPVEPIIQRLAALYGASWWGQRKQRSGKRCGAYGPIPPWDWRQSERERKSRSDVDTGYWLNTSTGVRHNRSCPNYRNTKRGRPCGADEGKACGMCGGGVRVNIEMPRIVSTPAAN